MNFVGWCSSLSAAFVLPWAESIDTQSAKPTPPRVFRSARSPEIWPDGRATFRFPGQTARKVTLVMEGYPDTPMVQSDRGIWSATVGPLEPDFYIYSFKVDGIHLSDPVNTQQKPIITGGSESILHIPGPKSLLWEENRVSHGTIHRHRYWSSSVGEARNFLVYTPPGYKPTPKKPYPLLVLLHGVMDDETAWTTIGRANVILDNLIARQLAVPMLLVMPLGYGVPNAADRVEEVLYSKNPKRQMSKVSAQILEEVMPRVEQEYKVDRSREGRAIAGFSMGGAQALYIGLNYPNRFGSVGSFSGATIMFGVPYGGYFPIVESSSDRNLPILWFGCGKKDFLLSSNQHFQQWLRSKRVPFEVRETDGGHTWQVVRRNLAEFAPLLFRSASK